MNDNTCDSRLSKAITWLRFPLIFLIIMLHCYSVARLEGSHETYFKVLYPFSLWLGETGVPGFYFISGFLFFLSKKTYCQKLETRIHALLIPYLIWNFLLLALYVAAFVIAHRMKHTVFKGTEVERFNMDSIIRRIMLSAVHIVEKKTYIKISFSPHHRHREELQTALTRMSA